MFDKFIIFFFYFFLISRFFSEKIKLLPKWIDIINYGLFVVILVLLIFHLNKKKQKDNGESKFINIIFFLFTLFYFISVLFNQSRILPEASVLFYLGFMEGPLLFIGLNKITKNSIKLSLSVDKLFFIILVINIFILILLDIPQFLISGNPDVLSGTYGNNTYQFSMLLLICGGYLLGYNYNKNFKPWFVILSQIIIITIFYLTQFRAGLLFFLSSYLLMIGFLYGKIILRKLIPIAIIILLMISAILFLTEKEEKISGLKFDDWITLLSDPLKFTDYGKFKIYLNIFEMWKDYPETFVIGSGPGNLLSRANNTFSNEILVSTKGVSVVINQLFGIKYPYYTELHNKYVRFGIKKESIFGTWQLSAPYTSYLSGIGEIGIIGGGATILLYFVLIVYSIRFFKIIKDKHGNHLPLAIALIGGTTYLFQVAFLDNYWEIARVTLPVWLLFWSVKTLVYTEREINDNI